MLIKRNFLKVICPFLLLMLLAAFAAKATPSNILLKAQGRAVESTFKPAVANATSGSSAALATPSAETCWEPLIKKLTAEGFDERKVRGAFAELGETYSKEQMLLKLRELYRRKFLSSKGEGGKKGPKYGYYKRVITDANIKRTKEFINGNRELFENTTKSTGVPADVAASLLLVETDLGNFLGQDKVFASLANLAASSDGSAFYEDMPAASTSSVVRQWLDSAVTKKSSWAYVELKSFLQYCFENSVDPQSVYGSVYGAMGLCQFMPSNISLYGVDGDKDGKIDLFSLNDAVPSLCNYLKKNGWRGNLKRAEQFAVLRSYNNSSMYANTILIAADKVSGRATPGILKATPKKSSFRGKVKNGSKGKAHKKKA